MKHILKALQFLMILPKKIDGWKTVLAYTVAQVSGSYPLVMGAYAAWQAAPADPTAISNLIAQLGLAIGVGHRLVKNLRSILL
jgi:hypothetical protein